MVPRNKIGVDIKTSRTSLESYKRIEPGDFVIHLRSFQGGFAYSGIEGIVSPAYTVFSFKAPENFNDNFWKEKFTSYNFIQSLKKVTYGVRDGRSISYSDFLTLNQKFPLKSEQDEIGKLLSKLDETITLLQRKLSIYSSLKNALLKTLYPYPINSEFNPVIHFEGYTTKKWKTQKLCEIFNERSKKNPNGALLSVSISNGVYPFNDKERKNNSTKDKSNYKQVEINDIAYNSMRMWQGALGVSSYQGIVSPAYTVIYTKNKDNPKYYFYYFKKDDTLFEFQRNSQGITSDTWNLKFPLFKNISISVSDSTEEKNNIAFTFEIIDNNINKIKEKISNLNQFKQFLLQNMFI